MGIVTRDILLTRIQMPAPELHMNLIAKLRSHISGLPLTGSAIQQFKIRLYLLSTRTYFLETTINFNK